MKRAVGDAALASALTEFLRASGLSDASVLCSRGVAVITGIAATQTESRAAEDIVRYHEGVRDVVNKLRVAATA